MLYFNLCFKQLCSLLITSVNVDTNITKNQHLAFQVDISDVNRPFYIEITNEGKVNIEPYEYNDRDGRIISSFDTLMKIVTKQISILDAYKSNKISINGDIEKLKILAKLIK